MGLFGKKEEDYQLPELPSDNEERILAPPNPSTLQELPNLPSLGQTKMINDNFQPSMSNQVTPDEIKSHITGIKTINPRGVERQESVFVKISKFRESADNFEKIKDKVEELENTIREIKTIREKEEDELNEWEADIQSIKEKIEVIDKSLFNRLE